jgi:hypothetical protein
VHLLQPPALQLLHVTIASAHTIAETTMSSLAVQSSIKRDDDDAMQKSYLESTLAFPATIPTGAPHTQLDPGAYSLERMVGRMIIISPYIAREGYKVATSTLLAVGLQLEVEARTGSE